MGIPLLWKDSDLLAANKPAGLLSIQDGYNPTLPHLYGLLVSEHGPLWIVHRLDKDTSGVILFARNAQAHKFLSQQFEHRETHKEYHALVTGSPEWEEQEIELPLRVNGDSRHRTVIDQEKGRQAVTRCRVMQRFPDYTLVKALPLSGYTHQIRAHLAAVGYPLLNDPLYKSLIQITKLPAPHKLPIERLALHAYQIAFLHPTLETPLSIQAPYPDDFRKTVQELGNSQEVF